MTPFFDSKGTNYEGSPAYLEMAKLAFGENTGNSARLGLVTEQPWLQCILASFRVFVIKLWALAKNWSPM